MKKILFSILLVAVAFSSCKKDDDDEQKKDVNLKLTVKSNSSNTGIKAFIFLGDSLYGTTNANGEFSATAKSGKYELTISASYYRDTTLQLNLSSNSDLNFSLAADSTMGKLYGEFQDMYLWREKLKETAEMSSWSEEKRWDAITGATIEYKYFDYELPNRYVLLGNDTIAETDGFGQYYVKLQCGTYKLTGACGGYSNASGVVKITDGSKNYLNFYLERK